MGGSMYSISKSTPNTQYKQFSKKNNIAFGRTPLQGLQNAAIRLGSSKDIKKHAITMLIANNFLLRPIYIMTNKEIPEDQKKYGATREAMQQVFNMAAHLGLSTTFEWVGFAACRKLVNVRNQKKAMEKFKEFATFDKLKKCEGTREIPAVISGSKALGSFFGSVMALTVVAPMLNNKVLPYVFKGAHKLGKKLDNKFLLSLDPDSNKEKINEVSKGYQVIFSTSLKDCVKDDLKDVNLFNNFYIFKKSKMKPEAKINNLQQPK